MKKLLTLLFILCSATQAAQVPLYWDTQDASVVGPVQVQEDALHANNQYPVFHITFPERGHTLDPWTEVQVRATTTNFQPGFVWKSSGASEWEALFMPVNDDADPKNIVYEQLGGEGIVAWAPGNQVWEWRDADGNLLQSSQQGSLDFPWGDNPTNRDQSQNRATWNDGSIVAIEFFVYSFCTTGANNVTAWETWGQGVLDGDARVFLSIQQGQGGQPSGNGGDTGSPVNMQRIQWDQTKALTQQVDLADATPVRSITFQPGRNSLGASEWLKKSNHRLIWIHSFETPTHPDTLSNGQRLWNDIRPIEWRTQRIQIGQ